MQFIIADVRLAKSRTLELSGSKLVVLAVAVTVALMMASVVLYHWVIAPSVAGLGWGERMSGVLARDDVAQRERFVRDNVDMLARQLGELQARMVHLESLGDRVRQLSPQTGGAAVTTGAAGKARGAALPGRGGALIDAQPLSMDALQLALDQFDTLTHERIDALNRVEAQLFEQKMRALMLPTQSPIKDGEIGSRFGWRIDPFTGHSAMHSGLDFQADSGTPILAAAGGVVVTQEYHPSYGNMVEIDHGNELVTRYAHASKVMVHKGDVIKAGQKIAEVGSTGRSTGAHLHFEVLAQGLHQDPGSFLAKAKPEHTVAQAVAPFAKRRR